MFCYICGNRLPISYLSSSYEYIIDKHYLCSECYYEAIDCVGSNAIHLDELVEVVKNIRAINML